MNKNKKLILQKQREKIVKDLDVNDILDELYSKDVVSTTDNEKIRSQKERSNRTRCLLDILLQGRDEAYDIFVDVLRKDYNWLSAELTTSIGCVNQMESEEQVYHDALTLGDVPLLPMHYIARTAEIELIKKKLRNLKRGQFLTLCGMKGSGKSVLAISAIRDQELLRESFNNRIYFINAGEARSEMDTAKILFRLGRILDDQFYKDCYKTFDFGMQGMNLMKNELKKMFLHPEFKEALVVLDDVAITDVVQAFSFGCKVLVTTQLVTVVPKENSQFIELNKGFNEMESLQLFSKCTEIEIRKLPNEARQIHNLYKGSPLAIALIGSLMEEYKKEASDDTRWKHYVKMIIENKDGRKKGQERSKDYLFNTIKHCLQDLPEIYRDSYKHFVLFVEDVNITSKVLEIILDKTKYEIEDIVTELKNRSLIAYAYNKYLQCYVYGIHDLLLSHLKHTLTSDEIVNLHRSLITNYLKHSDESFANLPNDNYIFTYIGYHLLEAQLWEFFPKVYFDLDFIGAKVKAAGIADLVGDFKRYKNFITKNNDPELCQKLKAFELFVQKYGEYLHEYPDTDIIQCGLQTTDPEVYQAALQIACKRCDKNLYLETQFVGQTIYITHTLDLNDDVCAACFANRTDSILVGDEKGEIKLWDHSYKSCLKTFQGHTQKITYLEMSEKGSKFLSVSEDGQVKIWSLENACFTNSGKIYDENGFHLHTPSPRIRQGSWVNFFSENGVIDDSKTIQVEEDYLTAASFSHTTEKYIVTGSQKGVVQVWNLLENHQNLQSQEELFLVKQNRLVTACTFSLTDSIILFACENLIFAYDFKRIEYLSQFVNDVRTTSLLCIQNCDTKIIAVSDKSISIWSWTESQREGGGVRIDNPKKIILDSREDANYICAAITWDGIYLIAGLTDHCISMWNIVTQKKVKEIPQPGSGLIMCLDTYLNEESNANVMYILLSGSDNRSVKQWHIGHLENHQFSETVKLSINFTTCWWNGHTPLTAAITTDDKVQVFSGRALISETETLAQPKCLAFSPYGQEVVIALSNGILQIFDYRNRKHRSVMVLEGEITYLEYLQSNETVLVAASDKGALMICSNGKVSKLKGTNKVKRIQRQIEQEKYAENKELLPLTVKCFLLNKAKRLLSIEDDGAIKSWKFDGINDVLVVGHAKWQITMCSITLKQDLIALTFSNGTLKIFEVIQAETDPVVTCSFNQEKKIEGQLRSCCFSSDGRFLAIGKDDGHIILWDVVVKSELTILKLHNSWVRSLVFSPPPVSGSPLVLVSVGDQIAWWDMTHILDKAAEKKLRHSGRRSRGSARLSRPESLSLSDLNLNENITLLNDSAWNGKTGRDYRRELLCAIKLVGNFADNISISPTFTSFVTVDQSGIMYIMNVLKRNGRQTDS